MNPLALNTNGHLPCRTPLSINTKGMLGVCGVTPETVAESKTRQYTRFHDRYLAQAQREDEELLLMCQAFIRILQ